MPRGAPFLLFVKNKNPVFLTKTRFFLYSKDNAIIFSSEYINDKVLEEDYVKSAYPKCEEGMFCGPEVIPEKQYLMLGDNRGNSQDGRYWGLLPQDRFIGRAKMRIWPLNRIEYFSHKTYSVDKN